jgi:glycosyltransferase involved in cell wall biosynthesis
MKSDNRVRLLVTVPQFASTTSPYREMIALARHIPKDEFALTICALREKGEKEVTPELKDLGVNCLVAQFRPLGQPRYHRQMISSLKDQARINQYGPFDIQHSLDFVSMPFEAFVARAQSRNYVFNHANLGENLQWRLLRVKAGLSKRVIAVSDSIAKLLEGHRVPRKKLRTVYLGIDLDEVDASVKSLSDREKGLIISVGRISSEKRHEDAIRALAEIVRVVPDAHLKLVGGFSDTAYLERLRKLVVELGLEERVEFLGLRKDVLPLLKSAECLIHCCEAEAFGWVIVEAMSVGCPVVSCESEGPSNILQQAETGLLVRRRDIEGYASSVSKILTMPDLAAKLSTNGRKAVEDRFTSKTMVQGFRSVYEEIMHENRDSRN